MKKIFSTKYGSAYNSSIEDFLDTKEGRSLQGKVQLIFTSPPFPLVVPKKYGNKVGEDYLSWMAELSPKLTKLLKPNGSMVIEIGNAWDKGVPTMSTLPLKTLMAVADSAKLKICQQLVWHNTAKLPGPATWVNVRRERVTDSFTHIWWYSPSEHPKASNTRVLQPYKDGMVKLLKNKKFNSGARASGHNISETGFLKKNKGAIPSSAILMANTSVDANYRDWCKKKGINMHPARMPIGLADFFIKFLTTPGDIVFDPFGGSCTTGKSAEELKRKWVCTEQKIEYLLGAKGRFLA
jgi:site-specific DNA-methyltransferase (cytosine-N4-specific)